MSLHLPALGHVAPGTGTGSPLRGVSGAWRPGRCDMQRERTRQGRRTVFIFAMTLLAGGGWLLKILICKSLIAIIYNPQLGSVTDGRGHFICLLLHRLAQPPCPPLQQPGAWLVGSPAHLFGVIVIPVWWGGAVLVLLETLGWGGGFPG